MTRYLIGFLMGLVLASGASIAQEWNTPVLMPPPVVIPPPQMLFPGAFYPPAVTPLPPMPMPHWQQVTPGPC